MTRDVGLKLVIITLLLAGIWKLGHRLFIEEETWQNSKAPSARYMDDVNDLRIRFALQMQIELNLLCSGDRGRMHENIELIGYDFIANRRASIEEARALHLYVMNKLVMAVNANEKLRPFLDERPFTYKRAMISISFEGPNGPYSDGTVAYISNVSDLAVEENRNKIFYRSIDPLAGTFQNLLEEHREEAVQRAAESPIPILKVHQTTPLETAIDEVLPLYVEEMQKRYHFECEAIGGKMNQSVDDIVAQFVLRKRATLDEAKKYMLDATRWLLDALNSSEKLKPFLSEYPFPSNRLKIRIRFAKSNYYRYTDGSLEGVSLENDEITYYKQPAPGWVVYTGPDIVGKENYQKAVKKAAQQTSSR